MIQPPCIHEYTKRQRRLQVKKKVEDVGFGFFCLFTFGALVWFFICGGFTGGMR